MRWVVRYASCCESGCGVAAGLVAGLFRAAVHAVKVVGVEFASFWRLIARGGVDGSVELGTIWVVDLVGSTRLAASVGPVRWDELRDEYFGLLREAIDSSGGREFKNTGDGLMVAFASASAAVGCAVLCQQLFERRYRGREHQLHVRIGLGTGESLVRDGDYFGMPATEAARLCEKAPADGILISPLTRTLAGRVQGAGFESVGPLELKGISEPMEAFSVMWEPLDPERAGAVVGRWPLPDALRAVPRIAYIGREIERGLLEHARGEARSGSRQVVLLCGEPGIGKTRLASYEALRRERGRVRGLLGRLLGGSRGTVRAVDRRVHAACRACLRRRAGAVRRTARRRDPPVGERTLLAGCRMRGRRRPPIPRPSGSCCSRPSPSCCARSGRRCRCA